MLRAAATAAPSALSSWENGHGKVSWDAASTFLARLLGWPGHLSLYSSCCFRSQAHLACPSSCLCPLQRVRPPRHQCPPETPHKRLH